MKNQESTAYSDDFFFFHDNFLYPSPTNMFIIQIVWDLLKNTPGDSLLDAGCGAGTLMRLIGKRRKFRILNGVDLSIYAVNIANNNFKKSGLAAEAYVKDVANFSFSDNFDIIILSEVIEHVENCEAVIKTIYDNLKNQGTLILTTPREDGRNNAKWDRSFHHLRRFDDEGIIDLLKNNGFKIKRFGSTGFPFYFLFYKLQYLIHRKDETITPVLHGTKRKIIFFLQPFFYLFFRLDMLLSHIAFFRKKGNTIYVKAIKT